MAQPAKQSWKLGLDKLPLLEVQHQGEIHQALEGAANYFVEHVQAPRTTRQLRRLMDTLDRWHEEGVVGHKPQKSPPPGWLLLQQALMNHEEPWIKAMLRDPQAVGQLAQSNQLASTASFAKRNDVGLNETAMTLFWRKNMEIPTSSNQEAAREHLARTIHWFDGAGLDDSVLDDSTLTRLETMAERAGYDGDPATILPGRRTDHLVILSALKRRLLEKQIQTPRISGSGSRRTL